MATPYLNSNSYSTGVLDLDGRARGAYTITLDTRSQTAAAESNTAKATIQNTSTQASVKIKST
jgi:hypothetical protein